MISVVLLVGGGLLGRAYGLTPPAGGAVSAGGTHVLSVKSNGTVWAWGSNYYGQLGDGTTTYSPSTPVRSKGAGGSLTGMVAVAAGDSHSLALKSDGTVWAWGLNTRAQLGDGTTLERHAGVQVQTATGFLSGVRALSAGTTHSLAVKADGTAWAWGENRFGQLGDGTTLLRPQAIQVQGLTAPLAGVVSVTTGSLSSYAVKNDGTLWAWGGNKAGGLGDGTTTDRLRAVQVQGASAPLTGIVAVAAGGLHAVALKSDGTVWAWGNNDHGQLGDGTLTMRLKAVSVKGPAGPLTGIVAIAAGDNHNLALKSDGTIWAWGSNGLSELGSSSATAGSDQAIAVPVDGSPFADVVSIDAGGSRSMLIKSDGTVWIWGNQFRSGGPIDTGEIRTWPSPTQQTIQLITDPSDTGDDPPAGGGDTGDVTGGDWGTTPGNSDLNVAYTYDALGRVQSETSNGVTHVYAYDLAGNRVHVTYGGTGTQLASDYDVLNRLSTLSELPASGSPASARLTTYGYDLNGNRVLQTLPNGENTTTAFDALNRQTGIVTTKSGGASLLELTQIYDRAGNVQKITENYPGSALSARTVTNTYDGINRLHIETAVQGATTTATTYTFDAANNRTEKEVSTTTGATTTTATTIYAYDNNSLNQLGTATTGTAVTTYGYDLNGSRETASYKATPTATPVVDTYGYDYENRLVSLTKNTAGGIGSYAYVYDYRTRRVERSETTGSTTTVTKSVFSGGVSVSEYVGTTNTAEYIRGSDWGGGVGGLLYSVRSGQPSFKHYNSRGDVITETNGSATATWQASYEAFGTRTQETGSTQDRQKANTKEEDPSGLLNEGFRYRDLATGSFITRDPLGFVDGPNMYAYVVQNPWSKFDPEGLSALKKVKEGIEAAIEAAKKTQRINNRKVINSEWAGKTRPFSDVKNGDALAAKYGGAGVKYTPNAGLGDFSDYAKVLPNGGKSLKFEAGVLKPNSENFNAQARAALSDLSDEQYTKLTKDHTWHHAPDGTSLELVPSDLHDAFRHSGGSGLIESARKTAQMTSAVVVGVGASLFSNTAKAQGLGGTARGLLEDAGQLFDPGVSDVVDAGTYAGETLKKNLPPPPKLGTVGAFGLSEEDKKWLNDLP
ncbi:MAG: RHS repeat-associated core domain-containing protein [Opitutaceae bacterium]